MTPEEKKHQEEKEAAEKAAAEKAKVPHDKAVHDKALADKKAADDAALAKLTTEQQRLAKEQADLHEKFVADKEKRRLAVKVEDLPELLPTSPENEWKDREKLLKELEDKK